MRVQLLEVSGELGFQRRCEAVGVQAGDEGWRVSAGLAGGLGRARDVLEERLIHECGWAQPNPL